MGSNVNTSQQRFPQTDSQHGFSVEGKLVYVSVTNKQLGILLAILLPLLMIFWLAVQLESYRVKRSMATQLNAKSDELDRQLSQYAVVPRLLANHPDIAAALKQSDNATKERANRVLLKAQVDSKAAFAFLLDRSGTTIAASNYQNEVSFVGRNYGFRPYFKGALDGQETTFFAVGATTGIPGYFVANPVMNDSGVIGVLVAKFDLNGLLDSWLLPPFSWLAIDEFGVVILSTDTDFLYAPTEPVSEDTLLTVKEDRRYKILETALFNKRGNDVVAYRNESDTRSYLMIQNSLSIESWTLRYMLERKHLWYRAMLYMLALASVGVITFLVYRNSRAQSNLVAAEQRHALHLEAQVEERTQELRSTQEALIRESNFAMLGRMSGAINHEINQPLASLRLNLASLRNLFEQKTPDMNALKQIVIDSDRTTKRIGRVVTTLRSLSAQRRVDRSLLNVSKLVEDVAETVRRERPALSNYLSISCACEAAMLKGNEILLTQALLNLLYNGFDAVLGVENPMVDFVVNLNDEHVTFHIADNGPGVPADIRDNLFKPFVSDKQSTSGMGLGLTLAELIAKEHDGELTYRPGESNGSVFTLRIPVGLVPEPPVDISDKSAAND